MAGSGAFDKDFGYLMPFMDRVAAAAGELKDPAAREELAWLMGEEKARWARIQELLGGAPGRAASSPAEALPMAAAAQASSEEAPGAVALRLGLTVGSLRRGA